MRELTKITAVEGRLLLREPMTWAISVLLPTFILVVLGLVFAPHRPEPELGGARFIDIFVPSMAVLSLAVLGVNALPLKLASYREKGVLRRLSTTPAHPANLLVAQLIVNAALTVAGVALLIVVGYLAFEIPLPQHPIGFVAAFTLGLTSLFAIGVLVAAIAPTVGTATAVALPIFFAVMFVGGVYLPRFLLPDIVVDIGAYTPPGVEGLLDSWSGSGPEVLPLVIMAVITVVAVAIAARLFRWE